MANYNLQAHVFSSKSGGCAAAFLSNYNTRSDAKVTFNNRHYDLPRWSISILPDCQNVVFNTAKVSDYLTIVLFALVQCDEMSINQIPSVFPTGWI